MAARSDGRGVAIEAEALRGASHPCPERTNHLLFIIIIHTKTE